MADIEKVIKGFECCMSIDDVCQDCPYDYDGEEGEGRCLRGRLIPDALELLKEFKSTLGIVQTADSITFISTGDAHQGEERGIMLGKAYMHEHIQKELLYRGLMTDEIRSVFNDATHI